MSGQEQQGVLKHWGFRIVGEPLSIKPRVELRRYDCAAQEISRQEAAAIIRRHRGYMRQGLFRTHIERLAGQVVIWSDIASPMRIGRKTPDMVDLQRSVFAENTRRDMEWECDHALARQIAYPDFEQRAMFPEMR